MKPLASNMAPARVLGFCASAAAAILCSSAVAGATTGFPITCDLGGHRPTATSRVNCAQNESAKVCGHTAIVAEVGALTPFDQCSVNAGATGSYEVAPVRYPTD